MKRVACRCAWMVVLAVGCMAGRAWAGVATIDLTPTGGSANSTGFAAMSSLVGGATITVGDKIFSGFAYSPTGDMPAATDVSVLGFKDASGNWGISFHGSFLDLPGGNASIATIGFKVTVDPVFAAVGWRISDAHLALGGVGGDAQSSLTVKEIFSQNSSSLNGSLSHLSDDASFISALTSLDVTKTISATASSTSTLPARVTVVDQSFSQTIPVPVPPAVLSGGALLAVVGATRLRRRV